MTHLYSRWVSFVSPLFAGPDAVDIVWSMLDEAYSEPFRGYHNWEHIAEMLALFDTYRSLVTEPIAVEMGIWFHDVIYDTHSQTNEIDSAELMLDATERAGWGDRHLLELTKELICDTAHQADPRTVDGKLLVDIDLSILGSEPARFERYEAGIRAEYGWVGADQYKKGRAAVLTRFLNRSRIYATSPLYDRFEAVARANLAGSLARLAGS